MFYQTHFFNIRNLQSLFWTGIYLGSDTDFQNVGASRDFFGRR